MQVIETVTHSPRLGAQRTSEGMWEFLVWAPHSRAVSLYFCDSGETRPMEPGQRGYHRAVVANLNSQARYLYQLEDGRQLPDPASRYQPEGVHRPSQVVDTGAFEWSDQNWKGLTLDRSIIYELHVGTFTQKGTFEALIEHLPRLVDLGVTTIELMPLAQFPGTRNWGYDGVYLFAPQNSYGGPESLQRLVNAAHGAGLAVALDVVYNHLGPEGNYLSAFGPYFTDRYRTPWGQAINFDGEDSDEVRRLFIENALYWMGEYHFDALRLDAVHGIFDFGARHFLAELKSSVAELSSKVGRPLSLIAESDLNDSRLLQPFNKVDITLIRNGAMIFIIPYTRCLPKKIEDIIPGSVVLGRWPERYAMVGITAVNILRTGIAISEILRRALHLPSLSSATRITIRLEIAPLAIDFQALSVSRV